MTDAQWWERARWINQQAARSFFAKTDPWWAQWNAAEDWEFDNRRDGTLRFYRSAMDAT